MTIREFFAAIRGATDLAWQSFLDLDIAWTLQIIGLFVIPACLVLWLVGRWLEQDERRASDERIRRYRDEFDD
jgi:membrane protein implicated in regulation of membrane protease activity